MAARDVTQINNLLAGGRQAYVRPENEDAIDTVSWVMYEADGHIGSSLNSVPGLTDH